MESRLPKLFQIICCEKQNISVQDIAIQLEVTTRTIYSDVKKLNILLEESNYFSIENKKGLFSFTQEVKESFTSLIKDKEDYSVTNPQLRRTRILEYILSLPKQFNLDDLIELFDVSRNTILNDLNKIKLKLQKSKISINSLPFTGFQLEGKEIDIRNQFLLTLQDDPLFLIEEKNKKINTFLFEVEKILTNIAKDLQVEWSDESYEKLIYVFWVTFTRLSNKFYLPVCQSSPQHNNEEKIIFRKQKELENIFECSLTNEECIFIATKISEASLIRYGQLISEKWIPFTLVLEELITKVAYEFNFQPFCNDNILFEGLLNHLRPAYKRAQSFEIIENPLFNYVQEKYEDLYKTVITYSSILEEGLDVKFSLQEISFFTLFFSASYERNKNIFKRNPRAILICGSGISTSEILKSRLNSIFEIDIVGTFSSRSAKEWLDKNEVDFILTTIPFNYKGLTSHILDPYLSKDNIENLENLFRRLPNSIQMKNILDIIDSHTTIHHPIKLKIELQNYLGISYTSTIRKGDYQPMLLDILTTDMIRVNYECKTRDEAVSSAGQLLVKKGYAKESYINAMIKNVKDNGTYIVIAPGIAMPHARPEEGALDIGLSIVVLKEPVVFGHPKNDPVKIVVGLCAVDHQSHLKALSELVDILGNEDKVKRIKEAKSPNEIVSIIKGGNEND